MDRMEKFKLGDKVKVVVGMEKGKVGHIVWEDRGFYTIEMTNGKHLVKLAAWIEKECK